MFNKPIKSVILITLAWILITSLVHTPANIMGSAMGLSGISMQLFTAAVDIAAALLFLALFKIRFRPDYEGTFRFENLGAGLLLGWPFVLQIALHLASVLGVGIVSPIPAALLLGLSAGVVEEVVFRGIMGANLMRLWPDERKIPLVVVVPSFTFGLIHMVNLVSGANLWITLIQIVFAFSTGVLLQAVMLRTGSVIPCIIWHALIDFTAYLTLDLAGSGTVLTQELSMAYLAEIVPICACLITAFYLIRPAKRAEINALWDQKWGSFRLPG